MTCKETQERWHRRLDQGGVDDVLDRHLADCAKCRTYAARMERLVGLLSELGRDTESLASQGAYAIARPPPAPRHGWSMPRMPGLVRIAAAIVIAIAAGLWYRAERNPVSVDSRTRVSAPRPTEVTLQNESRARFLAVAGPSEEPNVQTFWIYQQVAAAGSGDRS